MRDKKPKNVNIELTRIVACFFVVSIHLWGSYRIIDGHFYKSVLFGNCMTSCAVPLFCMITGYLYNADRSITYQYKSLLYRIVIPAILVVCFSGIILPLMLKWVQETLGYIRGLEFEQLPVKEVVVDIVTGNIASVPYCFHLWYVVELIKAYMLFPVFKLLCGNGVYERKVRRFFLALGFLLLVLKTTIAMFIPIPDLKWSSPIEGFEWYILWGYELKVIIKNMKDSQKYLKYGILGYVLMVTVMYMLSYYLDYSDDLSMEKTFINTTSIMCMLAATFLFVFLQSIYIPSKFHRIICNVGNKTWGIYLLHVLVYSVIWHLNIEKMISFVGVPVFCIIFSTIVVVVTGLGVGVIQMIENYVFYAVCCIKENKHNDRGKYM